MRPEQKTKSRSKLYGLINGNKELTGAAMQTSTWTILLNTAAATDTLVIGGHYFQFVLEANKDTAGDSIGTSADPHLVTNGATPNTTEAAAALAAAVLAETETTGAWGVVHPVNATGASSSTATVTIVSFPGVGSADTWIPDATFVGTDPTVTRTVTGNALVKSLSTEQKWNILDTTGYSTVNKQYYTLPDGGYIGEECNVLVKTITTSDTPTILGSLTDAGTDQVEALFAAAEDSNASFVWSSYSYGS